MSRWKKKEDVADVVVPARRFIPDIHGRVNEYAQLLNDSREAGFKIVQLGDTIDHGDKQDILKDFSLAELAELGYDSGASLKLTLDAIDEGLIETWIMANHEYKHYRGFNNKIRYGDYRVQYRNEQDQARQQIEAMPGLAERFVERAHTTPFWKRVDERIFVAHASYHPEMDTDIPSFGRMDSLLRARAIFGQTTGNQDADGMPERLIHWVGDVPKGTTVIVGHAVLNTEYITHYVNSDGGEVYFLDTGCGKYRDTPMYMDYVDGKLTTPFDVVTMDHYR
jgi:protein phosphatase